MKLRVCLALAAAAVPALAAAAPPAAVRATPQPTVLTAAQRTLYREVFAAIRGGRWADAAARLDAAPEGPLHASARAALYTAKGSPAATREQLAAVLASAPHLPEARQLAKLAQKRGVIEFPVIPEPQRLVWQDGQPRRAKTRSTAGDPVAASLEPVIQPLLVADRPGEAEQAFNLKREALSPPARTEFQQRIGWTYYLNGRDTDARRMTDYARNGTGEWTIQAAWVAGLAAWRQKDCAAAADAFATVGARAGDRELAAAGNYWAARADMACGRPERVQQRLRAAGAQRETFYGLLAAEALGIKGASFAGLHDFRDSEWRRIEAKPNIKAAVALAEIGERDLADEYVRHQARIGTASEHELLIHLACDLDMPATQYWLAHNVPVGARINAGARYPMPDWRPSGGWRVDQALLYAHTLQESGFRTSVVSHAGAVGLMQVRPGTAGDMARARGETLDRTQLTQPPANLEYGQRYLEYLRNMPPTGGLLPKVIAAFNAGPAPVIDWNARQLDGGDPLLYIESLPYWETRGYVPIVLRNFWVYELQAGKESPSREALVQGMWPKFPGAPGPAAVRMQPSRIAQRPEGGTFSAE